MLEEKEGNTKSSKLKDTARYRLQPLVIKKQAIEDYNQGVSLPEILSKYGISSATFRSWRRLHSDFPIAKKQYPESFKLQVVRDLVLNGIGIEQVVEQKKISKNTIKSWCLKYSTQLEAPKPTLVNKNESDHKQAQDERIAQLERALQESNLKIMGLETMINIAEKELKINIRKKSGTKQ